MKIAFVCSEDKWLGVSYLSSYLKEHGHTTYLLFDPMFFNKAYVRIEGFRKIFRKEEDFIRRLREIKPDLIGFPVLAANYQWAIGMAAFFKEWIDTPIIFGGPHATIIPDEVIANPQVDMVAVGEAEESLLELANTQLKDKNVKGIWFKEGKDIIKNKLRVLGPDIDRYPFPDDDLFYEQLPPSYRITPSVITSRGCPFSCTYCGNQIMQKINREAGSAIWVRQRSVANVLEELHWRKRAHQSRHFVLMDDIFSSNLAWLRDFVKEYKKRIALPFNCLAHPSVAKEETIALLKEAGCTFIDFGLQTGCQFIRTTILQRYEKNEDVIRITRACKKHKLKFALDCILNLPGDTEKTIKESLALFNSVRPDMVNCFPLAYLPGTKIVDIAKDKGMLNAADVSLIKRGRHIVYFSLSFNQRKQKDDYKKYSFLFVALPVLPQRLVEKILKSSFLFRLFCHIPRLFLVMARIKVQFKSGFWFIFSNVASNELFYLRNYFFKRTKCVLKKG